MKLPHASTVFVFRFSFFFFLPLILHLSAKAYSIISASAESVKLVLPSLLTMNVEEKS